MIYRKDVLERIVDKEWHFIGEIACFYWDRMSEVEAERRAGCKNPRRKRKDESIERLIAMAELGRLQWVRDICHDMYRDRMVHLDLDENGTIHRVKLRPKTEWRHHTHFTGDERRRARRGDL